MDEEATFAIGAALAAIGELMERKGLCAAHELADALGDVAIRAASDDDFPGRSRYLGAWAYMAKVIAADSSARKH